MNLVLKAVTFPALLAVLLLSAGGCSVLTIDVDVYKGRLTNDPGIQTHQLIAMAQVAEGALRTVYRRVDAVGGKPGGGEEWKYRNGDGVEYINCRYPNPEDNPVRLFLIRIDYLLAQFGPDDATAATDKPTKRLDFLMDEFLKESAKVATDPNYDPDNAVLRGKRTALVNALAFFGESVRSTANLTQFGLRVRDGTQSSEAKKQDDAAKQAVARAKQVEGIFEDFSLALQAIGNSILVQVDEMRQRDHFSQDEEAVAAWQRDALKQMYGDLGLPEKATTQRVSGPSPRSELDRLVFALEAARVDAVRQHGKESTEATQLAEAIEIAHATRANRIYLRPSSAYLRASYPVTSFQPGTTVGWSNMLTRHFMRQLPGGGAWGKNDEGRRRDEITAEIDRQFWQNVNQVRVAGAGNANYAIAKDDVGNWYVKSYSTDVSEIINSAQSLALFASGPGTLVAGTAPPGAERAAAAALAAGEQVPAAAGGAGPASAAPVTRDPKVTERQIAQERRRYDAEARGDYADVRDGAARLADAVKAAWAASGNAELVAGTATRKELDLRLSRHTAKLAMNEPVVNPAPQVLDALEQVKAFHAAVAKELAEVRKDATPPAEGSGGGDVAKLEEEHKKRMEATAAARKKADDADAALETAKEETATAQAAVDAAAEAAEAEQTAAKEALSQKQMAEQQKDQAAQAARAEADKAATAEKDAAEELDAARAAKVDVEAVGVAETVFTNTVGGFLRKHIKQRQNKLQAYETTIGSINQ